MTTLTITCLQRARFDKATREAKDALRDFRLALQAFEWITTPAPPARRTPPRPAPTR